MPPPNFDPGDPPGSGQETHLAPRVSQPLISEPSEMGTPGWGRWQFASERVASPRGPGAGRRLAAAPVSHVLKNGNWDPSGGRQGPKKNGKHTERRQRNQKHTKAKHATYEIMT